jgi:hypothetical protein
MADEKAAVIQLHVACIPITPAAYEQFTLERLHRQYEVASEILTASQATVTKEFVTNGDAVYYVIIAIIKA